MGCFSHPVVLVADTRMFVTDLAFGRQMLVYEARVWANEDVTMLLPLPVPSGTQADDVRFVTVFGQGSFFSSLAAGFHGARTPASEDDGEPAKLVKSSAAFLPDARALSTLPPEERLPESVLLHVSGSARAGFAVIHLKKSDGSRFQVAVDFPRRDPKTLFFPLAQIHDGRFSATAAMDHILYCQQSGPEPTRHVDGWRTSAEPAGRILGAKRKGIADPDRYIYMQALRGQRDNRDLYLTSKALGRARSPIAK